MNHLLTSNNTLVLGAIRGYFAARGVAPSLDDIASATGLSRTAVVYQLGDLVRKGRIVREPGKARSIRILDDAEVGS